ncbi:MAG: DUF2911 domain-containing protein [bacterium]
MLAACPRRAVAVALAALSLVSACSHATSLPPVAPVVASTTLLTRLGADTLAIEQFTRTKTHMEGVLVSRIPSTRMSRYSVDLAPNGTPTRADYSVRKGDGTPLPGELQSLSVRYSQDSVYIVGHRSAGDTTRAIVARAEMLPYATNSYGLYELAFARLLASGRDSLQFALVPLNLQVRTTTPLAVKLIGKDSARIDFFGNPLYARHDGKGGIQVIDGAKTTIKVRVERIAATDLMAVGRMWAIGEDANSPMGQASTRDTVNATLGRAHVWIDYGRPALRGRTVWTNGVLGDTLWRTGANAATQLRSDVDLVIGGAMVPAGTYTLWTAATSAGYHLVVNRQFGQWGTIHDAARDLVRVPLREASVAAPLERFTITVEPQPGSGGLLTFTWGTKQLSVPISAK